MQGKHSAGRNQDNNRKTYNEEEEIPKAFKKENEEEKNMNAKTKTKANKKHGKLKLFGKIVLTLLIILALLVGGIFWYINNKLGKMQKVELNEEDLGISTDVDKNLSGYRNIAIFGVDSRSDDYGVGNRSDCIIIASINNSTGDIKLISVYRDTYVNIDGHGLDKITHA